MRRCDTESHTRGVRPQPVRGVGCTAKGAKRSNRSRDRYLLWQYDRFDDYRFRRVRDQSILEDNIDHYLACQKSLEVCAGSLSRCRIRKPSEPRPYPKGSSVERLLGPSYSYSQLCSTSNILYVALLAERLHIGLEIMQVVLTPRFWPSTCMNVQST